jgi:hypothetical protein
MLPGATATSVTTRLTPIAEAKVSKRQPTVNFGSGPTLRTAPSPKVERSYLRFNVAGITGPVTSASLRLYAETVSPDGFAVRTVAATPWSEATITYANAPTPGPIVATSGPVAGDGWTSVDVTALVRGSSQVDLVLTSSGRSTGLHASRETGATAPQLVVVAGVATTSAVTASTRPATTTTTGAPAGASASPAAGRRLLRAGRARRLGRCRRGRLPGPSPPLDLGAAARQRQANHLTPDPAAVHAALAACPRAAGGAYDPRWDGWLLARVDGQFTGTTNEVFQWAACKWGLPDDLLGAVAVQESTWYQYLTYPSGRPVQLRQRRRVHGRVGDLARLLHHAGRLRLRLPARPGAGDLPADLLDRGAEVLAGPGLGRLAGQSERDLPLQSGLHRLRSRLSGQPTPRLL